MHWISHSPRETQKIAKQLLQKKERIFLLQGNLGSGKTTFVQGIGKALGIRERIKSPSFILMRIYKIQHPRFDFFCHADLYRTRSLKNIGLEEYLKNPKALVAIEWPKKIARFKQKTLKLEFQTTGKNQRKIILHE